MWRPLSLHRALRSASHSAQLRASLWCGATTWRAAGGFASEGDHTINALPSLRTTLPPSATDLPESSFLKCIEKERMDEKLRLDKEDGPPPSPPDWEFYHAEGTSLIYGRRVWVPSPSEAGKGLPRPAEKHFIRAQLTTRDPSLDPECDIRGEHFPFSLFIQSCLDDHHEPVLLEAAPPGIEQEKLFQDEAMSFYEHSLEVRCDLVDGELKVDHLIVHGEVNPSEPQQCLPRPPETTSASGRSPRMLYPSLFDGYEGPNLDEAEESVLDGLQAWLAERRIDDIFAEFIGSYSVWVEQMEYERWLKQLQDYVAA